MALLEALVVDEQGEPRRLLEHLEHAVARARGALEVADGADAVAQLLALLLGHERLAVLAQLLDRLAVPADVALEADEEDGGARAVAVYFCHPLLDKAS